MEVDLFTHEVAKILGVSRKHVLQLASSGRLGRKGAGRLPPALVSREEVEASSTARRARPAKRQRTPQQPAGDPPERAPAADPPAPQERGDIWVDRMQELMVAGRRRAGGCRIRESLHFLARERACPNDEAPIISFISLSTPFYYHE